MTVKEEWFLWDPGFRFKEQNQKYLKELGTVVYLKGSTGNTEKKTGKAPAKIRFWMEKDRDDKIKKLLKQRDPVYQKFADIQVVTGVKPFEELVHEIEEKLAAYEKNSWKNRYGIIEWWVVNITIRRK